MSNVGTILKSKAQSAVFTVSGEITVFHAIELMCEKNIGCLVITENDKIAGIFTERDYARKLILQGRSSRDTLIRDIMTTELISVRTKTSVEECMNLMNGKRIRHLPVIEEGKMVGMVSIGDLVSQIIADQSKVIQHLESYIKSA